MNAALRRRSAITPLKKLATEFMLDTMILRKALRDWVVKSKAVRKDSMILMPIGKSPKQSPPRDCLEIAVKILRGVELA